MNLVYRLATAASIAAFSLLRWDVRIEGTGNVPAEGGAVLATNHIGYLDFVFSGYGVRQATRRRVRFVAKREVFDHRVSGPLMRAMGHIAVDRGGNTGVALRDVSHALTQGDLVGMFPEGTINLSFVPGSGRPGAAKMAMDAGVPLIPGAIWGSQRIWTKRKRFKPSRKAVVTVRFGEPITYEPGESPVQVHERLMASIRMMVDELQRRDADGASGGPDAWWLPAHLGGGAPTAARAEAVAREERIRRRRERR